MHDSYTSDNARDWNSRYGNTFGFLIKGTERALIQFTDQSEDYVYFVTEPGGMNFHARINSGVTFEFIQVDNAWFNGASGAIYLLNRVPNRQWRRGLHKSNTSIISATNYGLDLVSVSFKVLNDIYYTATHDYKCNGVVQDCRALSRAFAIVLGDLYFYDQIIGSVDKDNKVITLNKRGTLVQQELTDVMRRNEYDLIYKLKVAE